MDEFVATEANRADEERTKRAFIGFLSSVLGVDQNYSRDDMYATNAAGQFRIANPDGTISIVGQPVSNVQKTGVVVAGTMFPTSTLLVIAAVAFFLLKR